jgi:hypothetical protein
VALGAIFVVNKRLVFWPIAVLPSIAGYALLGGVGWLTLLIVGVSYKLVPMFALTHDMIGTTRTPATHHIRASASCMFGGAS